MIDKAKGAAYIAERVRERLPAEAFETEAHYAGDAPVEVAVVGDVVVDPLKPREFATTANRAPEGMIARRARRR